MIRRVEPCSTGLLRTPVIRISVPPELAVSLIDRTEQATKAGCLIDFPDTLKALS
jgi:hypothetical protein